MINSPYNYFAIIPSKAYIGYYHFVLTQGLGVQLISNEIGAACFTCLTAEEIGQELGGN